MEKVRTQLQVRRGRRLLLPTLLLASLAALPPGVSAGDCEVEYESTFELIEQEIFVGRGCTTLNCHNGPEAAGDLDLSPGAAWENLIDQPHSLDPPLGNGLRRVFPLWKARSLLWLNLASATLPDLWAAPLRSMPLGGLAPLSLDELEVVRLWIESGAPQDGVVPGTAELLDVCLPAPGPLEVEPLPPPPPGTGIQIRAPRQLLPPQSEDEVCFVTYFDLTDQVPEEFRSPDGQMVRIKRVETRRDPLSHHTVVLNYDGSAAIDDPVWGPFRCRGGALDGQSCEPTEGDSCGDDGVCASPAVSTVACTGFGPGDASVGTAAESLFSSMATSDATPGVYSEVPIKGILVWNSHHFNATNEPGKLDIWVNLEFAPPEEQVRLLRRVNQIRSIFGMNVPAFGAQEICDRWVAPPDVDLLSLSSHVHQRGKRFRIFEGDFRCATGPNESAPCSPFGPDTGFPVPDLCGGAACEGYVPPPVGDCDENSRVTIDELVRGIALALGLLPAGDCPRFDADGSGAVTVEELVGGVDAALAPELLAAEEQLIYTSLSYVDSRVLSYSPPHALPGSEAHPAERTFTYCALYDNGFSDPNEVKQRSETPQSSFFQCGPTHCAEGVVGRPCGGPSDHATCDTSPGAGDGLCDACSLRGGVTTEDEMFILIGAYVSR